MTIMQRCWQQASSYDTATGYGLQLDAKPRLTPAGHEYLCPTAALAAAVAQEWQDAPEKFDPRQMPLTQLVATTHDIVAPQRETIITGLMAYARNDMLYFRAFEPARLVEQQTEIWQPYLVWAAAHYNVSFSVTHDLQPPEQRAATLAKLHDAMAALPDHQLAVLNQITDLTGSLLLGLALLQGWRSGEDIYHAAELDALFQAAQWGMDEEARQRQKSIERDILDCERFVLLLEDKAD